MLIFYFVHILKNYTEPHNFTKVKTESSGDHSQEELISLYNLVSVNGPFVNTLRYYHLQMFILPLQCLWMLYIVVYPKKLADKTTVVIDDLIIIWIVCSKKLF